MRGREKAHNFRYPLRLANTVCHWLPVTLCGFLFTLCRHWTGYFGFAARYVLLMRLASKCGENIAVFPGCYIYHPERLELENNISIREMCYIEAWGGIKIGSDVSIAHASTLFSGEHDYIQTELPIRDAEGIPKPIEIGNDVWIGAGVRVLGGVTIGDGSVIGAGAVVTKNIPPLTIAVGVPARAVGVRGEQLINDS